MWVEVKAWVGPRGWLLCVCQEVISGPGTWMSNCFKSQLLRPRRNLSGSPMARPMQSSLWEVAQSSRADSSPLPSRSHYPISRWHLLCPQNFNSLSRRPRQRSAAPSVVRMAGANVDIRGKDSGPETLPIKPGSGHRDLGLCPAWLRAKRKAAMGCP